MELVDANPKIVSNSSILDISVHPTDSHNHSFLLCHLSKSLQNAMKEKKKAHILFAEKFTPGALKNTYKDNISSSYAVGIDGIREDAFKEKLDSEIDLIIKKVENCNYTFTQYKPKLISKGPNNPPRVLSIPTIRDRLTLRVMNDILSQVFSEARISRPHVYIKSIKSHLADHANELAFSRIDIKDFYPSVDHEILMRRVRSKVRKRQLVQLVQSAISTRTSGVRDNRKGVPQGLSISNILSSIYLHKMDCKLKKKYTYFRYVDDILVICNVENASSIFEEI